MTPKESFVTAPDLMDGEDERGVERRIHTPVIPGVSSGSLNRLEEAKGF
jgi:hypothetical protein